MDTPSLNSHETASADCYASSGSSPPQLMWKSGAPPKSPGLYRWVHRGEIVYVGKSVNLAKRISTHSSTPWFKLLCESAQAPTCQWVKMDETLLDQMETMVIQQDNPRLNLTVEGKREQMRRVANSYHASGRKRRAR